MFVVHFTGPECEVVSNELHDGGGIFVLVLVNMFDVGDGVVEGLFGEVACLGGVVENL